MDVGGVGDAGPLHRDLHRVGDLGDHRDPADVLGQQHLAHREADGQPRLVGRLGVRSVAKIVACGLITPSVPPDHTIGTCLTCSAGGALLDQHLAERAVGDDPGVVVDAAVALGLADDRDDPVGLPSPRRR